MMTVLARITLRLKHRGLAKASRSVRSQVIDIGLNLLLNCMRNRSPLPNLSFEWKKFSDGNAYNKQCPTAGLLYEWDDIFAWFLPMG